MWEFLESLWRHRWTVALLALAGFLYGCQDAKAQTPTTSCNNSANPDKCDEGEAYVDALGVYEYWVSVADPAAGYQHKVDTYTPFAGVKAMAVMRTQNPEWGWQVLYSAYWIRLCAARPDIPNFAGPNNGNACFKGCLYGTLLSATPPIKTLIALGPVCAEGDTLESAPDPEQPDPCEENPDAEGCTDPEEPEEPEEPSESDGTGGNSPDSGGSFPGDGGNPGGSGHPGAGTDGGTGEEGQVCGGPNQPPCNMTLGDATLPSGCSAPPTCAGDPVACGILFTTWRTACNGGEQPEWTKVEGDGTEGQGEEPEGPLRDVVFDPTSRLDQGGFGSGTCPSLGSVNFKVGPFQKTIDFDSKPWWCDLLTITRYFMILLGSFVSICILLGWGR